MKIKRSILLVCCLLLIVSFGAAEEIAAYVNDRPITESVLQDRLQTSQIINNYATSEMSQDEKDEIARLAREAALQVLIQEEALLEEAEKRGLTCAHPEVQADADSLYEQMIASAERYVQASYPELSQEELDEQVNYMLSLTGATRESCRLLAERTAMLAALEDALSKEAAKPSLEAVQAYYDQLYAEQKQQFDLEHNSFEAAVLQGKLVLYRPTDLKMIQKAEFEFEAEALVLIRQTAAINPQMAEDMRADQHRLLLPVVEEAHRALISGERSFADVLEALEEGSSLKYNYFNAASTRFNEDYYSRADAFVNVGEISTWYEQKTGYAILYYAGDLPACEKVPLEDVYDQIAQTIAQGNALDSVKQAKEAIVSAAKIVICESGEQ